MRDIESRSASPPRQKNGGAPGKPGKGARNYQAGWMPFASERRAPALRATGESPSRGAGAPYLFSASVVFVAQTASLSVSPEIVAAREDFFNHGWTRINTDEDGFSLIRVHPCSSVVGHIGCGFAALRSIRRMPSCRTAPWPGRRNTA